MSATNNEALKPGSTAEQLEKARQDIEDIRNLMGHVSMQRYYYPRLKLKHSIIDEAFRHDEMTHEKREALRQQLIMIEEIRDMMAKDEAMALRQLESPRQQVPQRLT